MNTAIAPSPWPLRFALATLLCAVPLFAFGGIVTTIGAGMAVEGWWDAEGHFMPFFPIDEWLRDFATFVEHTHRQWGLAVGLFAICAVIASFAAGVPALARWLSVVALVAVGVQGTLGGLRVELVSRGLAFVHGGVAQLVFALLALHLLAQSRAWRKGDPMRADVPLPAIGSFLAAILVYAQIWVGAWYRHGLRGTGDVVDGRLHLHIALALVVLLVLVHFGRSLTQAERAAQGAGERDAAARLGRERRRMHALLGTQVLLGFLAWGARGSDGVTVLEIAAATGHVLVGAGLLASLLATWAWCRRLRPAARLVPAASAQ